MIHRLFARFLKAMARWIGFEFDYDATSGPSDRKTSATAGVPLLGDAGSAGREDHDGQLWIGTEGIGQRTALMGAQARMARRK